MESSEEPVVKIEKLPITEQVSNQTHAINVYFPDIKKPITVSKGAEYSLNLLLNLEKTAISWANELRS